MTNGTTASRTQCFISVLSICQAAFKNYFHFGLVMTFSSVWQLAGGALSTDDCNLDFMLITHAPLRSAAAAATATIYR
jgi:hypothetical protein